MIQAREVIDRWFKVGQFNGKLDGWYVRPITFHNPEQDGGICDCKTIYMLNLVSTGIAPVRLKDLQPIELTPENILKMGFKKYSGTIDVFFIEGGSGSVFEIIKCPHHYLLCKSENETVTTFGKAFNYIHQLQDIYAALTGEELTYTP